MFGDKFFLRTTLKFAVKKHEKFPYVCRLMYVYFVNLDIGCNGEKHFMPLGSGTDSGPIKSSKYFPTVADEVAWNS
jgi:hypothetical protein